MLFEHEVTKAISLKYTIEEGELKKEPEFTPEKLIVKYTSGTFMIAATEEGVSFSGSSAYFTSQDELDEFNRVIQWAFRQYQSLKETGLPIDQDILTQELLA